MTLLRAALFAVLLLLAGGVRSQSPNECQFTRDCQKVLRCQRIQDASCICKFGSCVISGNPFFRGNECDSYKDCACKGTPEICFCRNGFCKSDPAAKFECHESKDCSSMAKCKGKSCNCQGNLCEFQCNNDADCINGGFHCDNITGYKCKCASSICELEKLPAECNSIQDCVKIGKCTDDKPCACTNDQCVDPWFVETSWFKNFPTKTCRDASDCDYAIARCQEDKCTCENKVKVDQYSFFGECIPKARGGAPPPPPPGFEFPEPPPPPRPSFRVQ